MRGALYLLASEQEQNKSDQQRQNADWENGGFWNRFFCEIKFSDAALVWLTLCLVVVGAFQGYWLARTVKVSETAAQAAETSANAVVSQLRAYAIVFSRDIIEPTADSPNFIHRLEIRNTGQTPAFNLCVVSRTCVLDYPLPPNFDFSIEIGENQSSMMLGPNEKTLHDSIADVALSANELMRIKSPASGKRLFTYGTVRYADVFKNSRITNFCYFLEWTVGTDRYTISLHPNDKHNDAD